VSRDPEEPRTGVRAALRRWWGPLLALVLGTAGSYAFGMDLAASVVLGFGITTVVVLARRAGVEYEPEWGTELRRRQAGARGDLQDLAWSMSNRDGRVGERAMRRLRDVATVRLARHGLDLASADDTVALQALLGPHVLATLRRRSSPLPTVRELQRALRALEALGPYPPDRHPGTSGAHGAHGAQGAPDRPSGRTADQPSRPDAPTHPGRNR